MPGLFVLVSTGRAADPFAGVTFLVDTTPGQFFLSDLFLFDGIGSASFPVNLNQPLFAGGTLDLQGFEVNGLAPMNLFASNGLEVLLCH